MSISIFLPPIFADTSSDNGNTIFFVSWQALFTSCKPRILFLLIMVIIYIGYDKMCLSENINTLLVARLKTQKSLDSSKKAFISSDRDHPLRCARLPAGLFHSRFLRKEKFPIKQKSSTATTVKPFITHLSQTFPLFHHCIHLYRLE